jgi:hypothetical protein
LSSSKRTVEGQAFVSANRTSRQNANSELVQGGAAETPPQRINLSDQESLRALLQPRSEVARAPERDDVPF